jgi:hypothetical protein
VGSETLDHRGPSQQQSPVVRLKVGNALCTLAAIAGVAGLSILPPEHVHSHSDESHSDEPATHHDIVVHRHFAAHHSGAPVAQFEIPGLGVAHRDPTLRPATEDDDPLMIAIVFTAGKLLSPRQPTFVADYSKDTLADEPDARRVEAFLWMPPPHGPPLDPARPLRAPPASS